MSKRYIARDARDETASKAIANADRGRGIKFHASGPTSRETCVVDGGSLPTRFCPKCSPENDPEERIVRFIERRENQRGDRW
ncbi:hypothetical protein [Cellulosimicrobium cellulans]|uniref:hypothetical protein n=1 Tax=Cellulosimicrobium cellulans TaxID=1710 RepID=UPI002404F1C9|nr:hypothetical protein [Cellulosimicrobium cellulans]MDF9877476.1 hypothetical protein [Cellulosimicrobium cellulans]